MIGGFRKNVKRGNFRKKIVVTEDEEEGQVGEETETIVPVATIAPTVNTKPIINKLKNTTTSLSFCEELEKEDEFVLKRSKASLTLNEQVKREKKMKKKKETVNQDKNIFSEDKTNSSEFILTQSEIPFSTNGIQIDMMNTIRIMDENNGVQSHVNADYADNAQHHFSTRKKINNPGAIPDAATIYAMKKQREQARHFSGQANYIPLDTNKHEGRFKAGSSRLVREEMDDSSDEERIEMRGTNDKSHPALERRKQVAKALEEIEESAPDVEKDDDEILIWEDEQMKKGSKIPTNQPEKKYGPQLPGPKSTVSVAGMVMGANSFNAAMGLPATNYDYSCFYQPLCGMPPAEQKVVTVDMVEQRLTEQLETKQQLFRIHQQQCEKSKFDLDSSKENIVTLERKAADVSDRFTFFQDIRGYIKDLLECLNEKVKRINELEDSMHQLLKKRAAKLVTRRLNDVKDQVDELSGKNATESDRIANIKNRRIAERELRRTRRREHRKNTTPNIVHNDGMSSDDEMIASETLRFEADKDKIIKDSESIFLEVVEDFSSIRQVMNRFEQWKFAFNDSYKEAYLGLCLPKIFSPFIKLELLNWNPLEVEGRDYEDYSWYTSLVFYGYHKGNVDKHDEDVNLIPNIIEKALIPKLTVLIRDVWDPLSSKQTKVITFLLQRLIDDYPTITKESKTSRSLIETVILRLCNSVENEIYIPLYSRELLEVKGSPASSFLERQFWKGVKLLQNLMEWNWLLSQKKLLELGIDAILNRYLIIALQQFTDPMSTLEKAKSIVNILPKEWFENSDSIVVGMHSLARCLNGLASMVYKAGLGYTDTLEQKKMKITIKKIISLLMHIQAFDEARTVANTYSFRKETDSPTPTT